MSNERFEMQVSAAPRENLRLLYISRSRFGGDWHSTPHAHACTELFYCVRGVGQFNISGTMHGVTTDDMVIVNPQVEHTELSLDANPLEYVVLGIDGIEFLFNKKDEAYALLNCHEMREDVLYLLKSMLRELDGHLDGFETVCQNLLEVLLLWLVRANNFTLRPVTQRRGSKECAAVKRYLDENFTEAITLDDLAEKMHINKYYLVHTFNREYSVSPINYLIRRRIHESKYLLDNTDYSLSQISSLMGFSSLSYFSQSFRRQEGVSPNEYRKKAHAADAAAKGTSGEKEP